MSIYIKNNDNICNKLCQLKLNNINYYYNYNDINYHIKFNVEFNA